MTYPPNSEMVLPYCTQWLRGYTQQATVYLHDKFGVLRTTRGDSVVLAMQQKNGTVPFVSSVDETTSVGVYHASVVPPFTGAVAVLLTVNNEFVNTSLCYIHEGVSVAVSDNG